MKSRAARLSLLALFVVALGVTAFLFRSSDSAERAAHATRDAFDTQSASAARAIVDLRGAQQAYVAAGQDQTFWLSRVSTALAAVKPQIDDLRKASTSTDTRAALDAASGALQDFEEMDSRARDFLKRGDTDRAADLIFSSGTELTDKAVAALDQAVLTNGTENGAEASTLGRRRLFALAAAGGAALLVMLLLLPQPEPEPVLLSPRRTETESAAPVSSRPAAASVDADYEGWSSARRISPQATAPAATVAQEPVQAPPAAAPAPVVVVPDAPVPMAPPALLFNFAAVASLCTDLSRIDDTMALPPLLERAAEVLDAAGIILWIADPDGRELNPVLAQGYPQHLVMRLGTIPKSAENATAAAFRTSLVQTVLHDDVSHGAIAAPLVTCGGVVGVMSAEVRGDGSAESHKIASAAIIAAQLASLVGPPAARADGRAEAAGA